MLEFLLDYPVLPGTITCIALVLIANVIAMRIDRS